MLTKVGFVCTFTTQKEMIRNVARELSDKVLAMVEMGALERAISNARNLERRGAEIIVAWGGTANMLEREISIPVVRIPISDFFILQAVEQASKVGKRIALMTEKKISKLYLAEKLYGVEIKQVLFNDLNDFIYGVTQACNEGCDVLIGKGFPTLNAAKEFGKKAILITSDAETIKQAFNQALSLAALRRKEREEYTRLKTIFDSLAEGVVVIDKNEQITLFNQAAANLLGVNPAEALNQSISTILPNSQILKVLKQGTFIGSEFHNIHGNPIIANHMPILIKEDILGVVSTLNKTSEIQKIDSQIRRNITARGFNTKYNIDCFSANSSVMKKVIKHAKKFAATDSTILITGDTGTGKEVLAQSIHHLSLRSKKPFVAINCSVLPENLLESELFGYSEGAFTGAKKGGKIGFFELAHGGTLFLDEIGSIPMNLQSKLLRVLQEKQVMRLGGGSLIPINVRIISASNKNLANEVKKGLFRDDLFYRLNTLPIRMPSLKERKEDIKDLIPQFISFYCKKYKKGSIIISNNALRKLMKYTWPGNVRELEHVIERFVLLSDGSMGDDSLLSELLDYEALSVRETTTDSEAEVSQALLNKKTIKEVEREQIVRALENSNFTITRAASALGVARSTLYRKLREYNLR